MAKPRKPRPEAEPSASPVTGQLALYKSIWPLSHERHGTRGLPAAIDNYRFAAQTPLIPLTLDEFERAALDYPIAFVGERNLPFAVMGLTEKANLFVDDGGAFEIGAYIPAFLRRYPFVLVGEDERPDRFLCIDESALQPAGRAKAVPLYDGEQPSQRTVDALAFAEAYEVAERNTGTFFDLLTELDLLEEATAERNEATADTPATMLLAFRTIAADRLRALDGERLARLAQAGVLGAAFAQVLSQANWQVLSVKQVKQAW